jgi:hypothetical protein
MPWGFKAATGALHSRIFMLELRVIPGKGEIDLVTLD